MPGLVQIPELPTVTYANGGGRPGLHLGHVGSNTTRVQALRARGTPQPPEHGAVRETVPQVKRQKAKTEFLARS